MPRSASARRPLRGDTPREERPDGRFSIELLFDPERDSTLAEDVRRGLAARRKSIPPKHFYDDEGSRLFDRISELPEYYLTRTEQNLLESSAGQILEIAQPTDLIELGSGAAKKTRALLDAAEALGIEPRYRPFDVCESMLRTSAEALLDRYPWLEVRAVLADYERHLDRLPQGERRLVVFLGSTIGNFPPERAADFVAAIASELRRGEHFLLGADLVKPSEVLEPAYDDPAGITAEFNRNVLRVINRELGGNFDPTAFDHFAYFNRAKSQIEMHLRPRTMQRVRLRRIGLNIEVRAGETIQTEISRKFTRRGLEALCRRAGFTPRRWFTPDDGSFGLILAERTA
ncbi:MAG: L-histidine N(alpha)-methyltransferase [Candidatus Binatia bacterium]